MIELTEQEKQLIIAGLNQLIEGIKWSIDYPYWDDNETEEEYYAYWNNKLDVINQLLEKLQ